MVARMGMEGKDVVQTTRELPAVGERIPGAYQWCLDGHFELVCRCQQVEKCKYESLSHVRSQSNLPALSSWIT